MKEYMYTKRSAKSFKETIKLVKMKESALTHLWTDAKIEIGCGYNILQGHTKEKEK